MAEYQSALDRDATRHHSRDTGQPTPKDPSLHSAERLAHRLGYDVIGPLCYGFVCWLVERVKAEGIQDLYFLSRDGWLLQKAFDRLPGATSAGLRSHYLYSSRRAVWFASLTEHTPEKEYNEILSGAAPYVSVERFLSRLFISASDYESEIKAAGFENAESRVATASDKKKLRKLFKILRPVILEQAKKEREDYLAYLRQEGFFDHRKVALVDVGWTGSIIKYTRALAAHVEPHPDIQAYFIGVGNKAKTKYGFKKNDHLHGYLFDFDDSTHADIRQCFFVIEKFLSPNQPSLMKMKCSGGECKPVYVSGVRELSPLNSVVQEAALQYVSDRGKQDPSGERFDKQEFLPQLENLLGRPDPALARLLSQYSYSADFGYGMKPRYIARSESRSLYRLKPLQLLKDYRQSRWKAGFIAQQEWAMRLVLRMVRRLRLDHWFERGVLAVRKRR